MKIVIQSVVARPDLAPRNTREIPARPDDPFGDGQSWRTRLLAYNDAKANPLAFLPAYQLYADNAYTSSGAPARPDD